MLHGIYEEFEMYKLHDDLESSAMDDSILGYNNKKLKRRSSGMDRQLF